MKIAILGTRGVPNHYGGFEQFAEFFSLYLVEKGHDVYVYNSHNHPYREKTFKGVNILHKNDPEHIIGTFGQFIYDFNCIVDSRKRNFDIILQLGYTSNSVWHFLLPRESIIITNMDGLEWKRTKYSKITQQILKFAEKLAIESSHYLIADSVGIQNYISNKYKKKSRYIAYGASIFENPQEQILQEYNLEKFNFNMILARLEPENSIEIILDGNILSGSKENLLVIGNQNTKYGCYLKNKFKDFPHIRFLGAIYNLDHLNNLRYFSNLYFHGHTVGGTNPSLLEAMASESMILAHNNEFNKGVLKDNAFYFSSPQEVSNLIKSVNKKEHYNLIQNNLEAIRKEFNWKKINDEYLQLFTECFSRHKTGK